MWLTSPLPFLPCSPHAWPSPRKTYAEALWSTAYRNCTELSKECIIGSKWGTITQFNINPTSSQCDFVPFERRKFYLNVLLLWHVGWHEFLQFSSCGNRYGLLFTGKTAHNVREKERLTQVGRRRGSQVWQVW